jgi:hypothetical protein
MMQAAGGGAKPDPLTTATRLLNAGRVDQARQARHRSAPAALR